MSDQLTLEETLTILTNAQMPLCAAFVQAQAAELERLTDERDALLRFKQWVHAYLDGKNIPFHPPGTHGAEGCRIGDRMDFVFARLEQAKAANLLK